jgi:hypothetical protein
MVVVEAAWYLVLSTARVALLVLVGMALGLLVGLLLAPSAVESVTGRLELDSMPATAGGGPVSFRAQLSEAAALEGQAGRVAQTLGLPAADDFVRRVDRLLSLPAGS